MSTFQIATLLLSLASSVINAATKLRAAAEQKEEWTADEEDAFDTQLKAAKEGTLPHWRVEPNPDAIPPS